MRWWRRGPWADRDRVGVQLAWASVLVTVLLLVCLVVQKLVF